ncbi:hypothetical protein D3C76_1106850 [compost metagenome]
MFGQEATDLGLAVDLRLHEQAFQRWPVDRVVDVRVYQVEVFRLPGVAALDHLLRELVDERQEPVVIDPAIPHAAGIVQLRPKDTGRWFVRLRRQPDDETFGPGQQAARSFADHVRRFRVLAEQPGFIDQNADGLFTTNHVAICGHHFQRGSRLAMSNEP